MIKLADVFFFFNPGIFAPAQLSALSVYIAKLMTLLSKGLES